MSSGLRRRTAAAVVLALSLGCGGPDDPAAPGAPAARAPRARPDVVVFVLDAARADHLGCYGYARATTPHIDAFARGATRYTRATSEAAFTFAAVASLFTGTPPQRSGLLAPRPVRLGVELLAERARAAGYRTHAYSENPFVSSPFGLAQGFATFDAEFPPLGARERRDEAPARAGVRAALDFAARAARDGVPYFLYVHVLRPHNPYAPEAGLAGRFGSGAGADGDTATLVALDRAGPPEPDRLANIVALYDENLATGDARFGELHDGLRDAGLLDHAVVAVLSDHGEAFGEHGRMLHSTTVFEEMVRVPLIVRVPGAAASSVDAPVQLADLGSALGSVMTGTAEPSALARLGEGRAADAPVVSWAMRTSGRVAVRAGSRKVVVDTADLTPLALYDLASDPAERHALPPGEEGAHWAAWLRERIGEGPLSSAAPDLPAAELPLRRRLEALGYVQP